MDVSLLDFFIWDYGLNDEIATYLILLFLGIYLYFRIKSAKIKRGNIEGFCELCEEMLLEENYGDLCHLFEKHIDDILKIRDIPTLRNGLSSFIKPKSLIVLWEESNDEGLGQFYNVRNSLAEKIKEEDVASSQVLSILQRVFNNEEFVFYLSKNKPYLGIKILASNGDYTDDFLTLYIASLIKNKNSIFYYELEQTRNFCNGHRYDLYEDRKLLYFLFKDIKVSKNLGIYKPVGDVTCDILDYDVELIAKYNKELAGNYDEYHKYKCPIDNSLHFFEIMIVETMHQGIQDHMWLHYFALFSMRVISKMESDPSVNLNQEFPTPFYYILYRLVSVNVGWLKEAEEVKDKLSVSCENSSSIPNNVIRCLGNIVFGIISSDKVCGKFKVYILEIITGYLTESSWKEKKQKLEIDEMLIDAILDGGHASIEKQRMYLKGLKCWYNKGDHVYRFENKKFNDKLASLMDT